MRCGGSLLCNVGVCFGIAASLGTDTKIRVGSSPRNPPSPPSLHSLPSAVFLSFSRALSRSPRLAPAMFTRMQIKLEAVPATDLMKGRRMMCDVQLQATGGVEKKLQ